MVIRRTTLSCVFVMLSMALVGVGPASAGPGFTVTVNRTHLISGHVLTVTASSTVPCTWGIRWTGQTQLKRNTKLLVARFVAPRVTKAKAYRLLAICNYRAGTVSPARSSRPVMASGHRTPASVQAVVPPHWFRTVVITVGPTGVISKPSSEGPLPNTGGPLGSLVVVAFGLVLTGAAALRLSRHRIPLETS